MSELTRKYSTDSAANKLRLRLRKYYVVRHIWPSKRDEINAKIAQAMREEAKRMLRDGEL